MDIFEFSDDKFSPFVQCSIAGNFRPLGQSTISARPFLVDIFNHRKLKALRFLNGCAVRKNKNAMIEYFTNCLNSDIQAVLEQNLDKPDTIIRLFNQNKAGENLFLLACRFGDIELMQKLTQELKARNLFEKAMAQTDKSGQNAFIYASSGIETKKRLEILINAFENQRIKETYLAQQSSQGVNILHILARKEQIEEIELALSSIESQIVKGNMMLQKDIKGNRPWNFSIERTFPVFYSHSEAKVQDTLMFSFNRLSPFQSLISKNRFEDIKFLLKNTKSQELRNKLILHEDEQKNNALLLATKLNNVQLVIMLLFYLEDCTKIKGIFNINIHDENAFLYSQTSPILRKIFRDAVAKDFYLSYISSPNNAIVIFSRHISDQLRACILSNEKHNILIHAIQNQNFEHVSLIISAFNNEKIKDSVITYPILKLCIEHVAPGSLLQLLKHASKEHKVNNILKLGEQNKNEPPKKNILIDILVLKIYNDELISREYLKAFFKVLFADLAAKEQVKIMSQGIDKNSLALYLCTCLTMNGQPEIFDDLMNSMKAGVRDKLTNKHSELAMFQAAYKSGMFR